MKEYTVIYESGRCITGRPMCRTFPLRIATGKTRKQVERLIREAIEFHIEGLVEHAVSRYLNPVWRRGYRQ